MVVQEELGIIKSFRDYYNERDVAVTKHFMRAAEIVDEESIHELRVEIKKTRAFLELIKGVTPYFDLKKAYSPIRTLFKMAAPIRDSQVLQTMTREYIAEVGLNVNISEYFNLLKQKEMAGKKDFIKLCKKFDLTIFKKNWASVEKALGSLSKSVRSEACYENRLITYSKDYIISLFGTLSDKQNQAELKEEDFHDIRILCKKSRYTLEILSSLFEPNSFELLNSSLKSIHQPLGHWHDTDEAINLLNRVLSYQSLRPLFCESSYNDMLQSFSVRKQHFNDLFLEKFKKLNLKEIMRQ
ncbi:MAG: CHAD domain-containing protein [Desulfamplus sp.]|nr:CHAD domain-containing protein [Desulfamplus sp.]